MTLPDNSHRIEMNLLTVTVILPFMGECPVQNFTHDSEKFSKNVFTVVPQDIELAP